VGGTGSGIDEATEVAVDGAGDAFAAGSFDNAGTGQDLVVMKLAAATGAELWRREIDGDGDRDFPIAMAVHASGDVVVAGITTQDSIGHFTVIKFAGGSGTELWRQTIAGTPANGAFAAAVAIDSAGDVVAGGALSGGTTDFTVLKLAGATGAELWRYRSDGLRSSAVDGQVTGVAVIGGDDVVAGGVLAAFGFSNLAVVKLAGASGTELWRQELGSGSPFVRAVSGDGDGGAFVSGALNSGGLAVRLGGMDGAVGPVSGRKLLVRDNANDPGARRIDARLKDVSIVTPDAGSSGDPTLGGAVLELVNPGWGAQAQPDVG
jgi:outer membrane protein assembly factor BamB